MTKCVHSNIRCISSHVSYIHVYTYLHSRTMLVLVQHLVFYYTFYGEITVICKSLVTQLILDKV